MAALPIVSVIVVCMVSVAPGTDSVIVAIPAGVPVQSRNTSQPRRAIETNGSHHALLQWDPVTTLGTGLIEALGKLGAATASMIGVATTLPQDGQNWTPAGICCPQRLQNIPQHCRRNYAIFTGKMRGYHVLAARYPWCIAEALHRATLPLATNTGGGYPKPLSPGKALLRSCPRNALHLDRGRRLEGS